MDTPSPSLDTTTKTPTQGPSVRLPAHALVNGTRAAVLSTGTRTNRDDDPEDDEQLG